MQSQPGMRKDPQDLPGDARLLGYNRDVGFFLSEALDLVYVQQGGTVWTFPRLPGAQTCASPPSTKSSAPAT